MKRPHNLVLTYIYLAVGCGIVGVVLTFLMLFICQYLGIDISKNWWIVALPVTLSVLLNVSAIELYLKYRKK